MAIAVNFDIRRVGDGAGLLVGGGIALPRVEDDVLQILESPPPLGPEDAGRAGRPLRWLAGLIRRLSVDNTPLSCWLERPMAVARNCPGYWLLKRKPLWPGY